MEPELARCVFASSNPGKLREVEAVLGPLGMTIVAQSALGIAGAAETATTFAGNALLKARKAAQQSGLPAIADDSGLCVDALGGRPGVESARYAGADASDADNVRKLLAELRAVPEERRKARFHCAVVLVMPDDSVEPLVAEADWRGVILAAPTGSGGFGYDPVFHDPATGKAAAEMTIDEKNRISHRGKALRLLADRLQRARSSR
ncbi:MAG: RdgB/HAM1 family non-canonical purine NTP pyrophosphatase [Woeseiaceae bacterium]|nr:RdgB/HAM1 family non-canonical purine NTP pyrophosphatase [Woeseiaceae bacterium]